MTFELFKKIVTDEVARKMGNDYRVTLRNVRKNNDILLSALVISENGTNLSPTIYLNEYYESYNNCERTINAIANNIIKVYNNIKKKENFDVKLFMDFEKVRPRIIHKLINTERNRELLQEVPSVPFFDLSIIFQILLPNTYEQNLATITITYEHCKLWEIDIDELVFAARRNTSQLLPYVSKDIDSVISELLSVSGETLSDVGINDTSEHIMYVLSNVKKTNGATVLLDKNFLRKCSDDINSSYYILPSSIHECLLIPDNHLVNVNELKNMVESVNNSEVREDEILSYSVYYFDRDNDRLSVL